MVHQGHCSERVSNLDGKPARRDDLDPQPPLRTRTQRLLFRYWKVSSRQRYVVLVLLSVGAQGDRAIKLSHADDCAAASAALSPLCQCPIFPLLGIELPVTRYSRLVLAPLHRSAAFIC